MEKLADVGRTVAQDPSQFRGQQVFARPQPTDADHHLDRLYLGGRIRCGGGARYQRFQLMDSNKCVATSTGS
jgi:hypothetical protein